MDDLMTAEQVAAEYPVSVATLRWWVQQNRGPRSFRAGKRRFWKRADVEAWFEEQYANTSTGGAA